MKFSGFFFIICGRFFKLFIGRKLLLAVQYEQLDVFKSLMDEHQSYNGAIPNYVFLTVLRMIVLRDLDDFVDPLINSDNAIVKYSRDFLLFLYKDRTFFVKEIKQEIMKVLFNNPENKEITTVHLDDRHVRDESLTYEALSKKLNGWYKNLYDKKLVSSVYFEGESNQINANPTLSTGGDRNTSQNQANAREERELEKSHEQAVESVLKGLNNAGLECCAEKIS